MSLSRQRQRNNASSLTARLQSTNTTERRNHQDLFRRTSKSPSNNTANEAQKIQQSLMKTQHLLKNELHRVSMIENAIDTDERHLRDAMDHHKSLDTKQAQRQLSALQNAQRQERRVLAASIAFFGLAVLYILWSRVLYRLDFVSVLLDRMV